MLVQPMVTYSAGVNASHGLHYGVEPPERCGTLSADPSPEPKHCKISPYIFPDFQEHVYLFNIRTM